LSSSLHRDILETWISHHRRRRSPFTTGTNWWCSGLGKATTVRDVLSSPDRPILYVLAARPSAPPLPVKGTSYHFEGLFAVRLPDGALREIRIKPPSVSTWVRRLWVLELAQEELEPSIRIHFAVERESTAEEKEAFFRSDAAQRARAYRPRDAAPQGSHFTVDYFIARMDPDTAELSDVRKLDTPFG
jgi:hypothetical protein